MSENVHQIQRPRDAQGLHARAWGGGSRRGEGRGVWWELGGLCKWLVTLGRASVDRSGAWMRGPPPQRGGQAFVRVPPTRDLGEGFPGQSFTTLNSCQAFNTLNKISITHREQLQSGKLIEAGPRLHCGHNSCDAVGSSERPISFPESEQGTLTLQMGLDREAKGLGTEEAEPTFPSLPCPSHRPV